LQSVSEKKYSTTTGASFLVSLLASFSLLLCADVRADNFQEATKLFRQGDSSGALAKVEAHLVARPNDPQGRFLKGVILSEQQKTAEAIRIFTGLTEDHPELPEPYNNLAVLYANQAQYDKARNALEMAIRTHPSYAVAHENLGDIYATMASQAYDKALKLDNANTGVKAKLSLIKEIFTPLPVGKVPAKIDAGSAVVAAATPAAAIRTEPAGTKEAVVKDTVVKKPDAPASKGTPEESVADTLRAWAKAWSSQDVSAYLAFYAPEFKTPGGEARAQWEATRRERITRPKRIEVGISDPRVNVDADGKRATASFRQTYRSDALKSSGSKTLTLVRSESRWLIVDEKVGD
jgi:tetratricopeptide (TPR) repeat protein